MRMCFLGGTRYSKPLNLTNAKKFEALASLGQVFVVGFSQDLRPYRFIQHAHFYLFPRWPLPILRYLAMITVGPWLALWLVLRHRIQVLVAQSPYEGFAAVLAKVIARLLGRRVVLIVESHGDFEESIFLQRRIRWSGLYRFLMRYTASFALKHADLLRAVSNSTRSQIERWAPGKPIVQFPAWTNIEVFLKAGQKDYKKQPEVLYAGVLIPGKGVHHLIQAFGQIASEFPDVKLIIAGREENPEYVAQLRQQVACLGLDGRVVFMGEVSQAELAELMGRAIVFVLPSLSEGLPRVIIEAMAAGTPVVGSQVAGIPEIVQDGVTGFLIPPGDEEVLADRLRWILSHPEDAKAMGVHAHAFAQSFFSPEAYIEGYRRLFAMAAEILNESG